MPLVTIEVRRSYSPEQETALMEAVHAALRAAFKILPHDRDIRFVAHPPHRFECSPKLAKPELFMLISIDAFSGRSLDAKRALYRGIVDNLEPLGVPRDHVKIVLREVPRENWGVRGGQAATDVELGYVVEV